MDKNSTEETALIKKENNEEASNKNAKWTKDHEKILIDWADKAMCYRWLHAQSHAKLSIINTYFTIPVIIMSTLTGTANFAAERVPEEYRSYFSMAVGGVNILAGIITTIQQFLKISELNESHRISSISWDKFYRKIRVELAKPPAERQNSYDFLKSCTEEFDRLMETSPDITKPVIMMFEKTFNGPHLTEEQREMFKALKKPEICNSLESIQFSMFKEDANEVRKNVFKGLLDEVVDKTKKVSKEYQDGVKNKVIDEFVNNFKEEMMRGPTKEELMNNLNIDVIGIGEAEIERYIKNNPDKFTASRKSPDQIQDLGDIEHGLGDAMSNMMFGGVQMTSSNNA